MESCVLGLAGEAERVEFEQMCALHTEVRAARDAFELSIEQQALAGAVAPPVPLRETILQQLAAETVPETIRSAPVVQMRPIRRSAVPVTMRYVAAAAVILLAGSALLNIYYFNKYRDYNQRYDQLLALQTQLAKNNNAMQTRMSNYEQTIRGLTNPYMARVTMEGKDVPDNGSPDPGSVATVLWDTRTKDVYLMVNNLPMPETGKQYQLWAIVDNQPVDAGMLDMSHGHMMVKMKNIPRAQLFAITLEQQGGSVSPKGPMYVMGKV
ncbi:anti-sigma factor [Niastella yeongjuensis]|uniref:anti-sigma factor n=1 Tax=Niastella yeongjuensis TaxID=354355 RepID=UPI001056A771|nr:anti-sigma factor [Niastella yeongjuensis]